MPRAAPRGLVAAFLTQASRAFAAPCVKKVESRLAVLSAGVWRRALILFFMTPVSCPCEAPLGRLRFIVDLNPVASIIDNTRRVSVLACCRHGRG
jgi:hypothetical protein